VVQERLGRNYGKVPAGKVARVSMASDRGNWPGKKRDARTNETE